MLEFCLLRIMEVSLGRWWQCWGNPGKRRASVTPAGSLLQGERNNSNLVREAGTILQGSHKPPGFSWNPWALGNSLHRPVPRSNLMKCLPIRAIIAALSHCLSRCLPPAAPAGDNISLLFLVTAGTTNNTTANEGPSKSSRAEGVWAVSCICVVGTEVTACME